MKWNRKDLIAIEPLSRGELKTLFQVTAGFKRILARTVKKVPTLRGKTIVNLFLEPSTRTRLAFEMAATRFERRRHLPECGRQQLCQRGNPPGHGP